MFLMMGNRKFLDEFLQKVIMSILNLSNTAKLTPDFTEQTEVL